MCTSERTHRSRKMNLAKFLAVFDITNMWQGKINKLGKAEPGLFVRGL
jgi:hypothetical protein